MTLARACRVGAITASAVIAMVVWTQPGLGHAASFQRDAAQTPARDSVAGRAGTGSITGTVTSDEPNGGPVRRAVVEIVAAGSRPQYGSVTDDRGRFALTSLPPGRYTLVVNKPGWVRSYYGAKRLWRPPGVQIVVADGQQVTNVAVKILRGAVITGRVRDAHGQPLVNARPNVFELRVINGQRRLLSVVGTNFPVSDDRGEYRIFGLPPGSYRVGVAPPPVGAASGFRVTSPDDVRWATGAGIAAAPGTTAPAPATGPPPAQPIYGHEPTYYPGVTDPLAAGTITIAPGEERNGIDFTVRPTATTRIAGTVSRADGQPLIGAEVELMRQGGRVTPAFDYATPLVAPVGPGGRFQIPSVRPGRYTLVARARGQPPERPTGAAADVTAMLANPFEYWALEPVIADGRDVDGIALTLQPGVTISGRVTFEATTQTPPDATKAMVVIGPASISDETTSALSLVGVPAAADGTFAIRGVPPDRYLVAGEVDLGARAGDGWIVKSVTVNGRDVVDGWFDVAAGQDIRDVVVTFSDRVSEISGLLLDAAGQPVPGYYVFVFPADRSAWTTTSRRHQEPVRPDSSGRYRVGELPPGEYYIAALTDFEGQDATDASFLEQIIPSAIKITIGEGEKKVQNIRLAGG